MVNDFDSKYRYKSIYTSIVSSNFEARTTFLFLTCLFNGLFYSFNVKVIENR